MAWILTASCGRWTRNPWLLRVPASATAEGDATLRLLLLRWRPGQQRFCWGWRPYLRPHRRELIGGQLCAVNVLALVTPLGVMRLINAQTSGSDYVISIGVILVLAGVVQALITAVRSPIFTGIANRVDMDTRETILDRLVRLLFDARPGPDHLLLHPTGSAQGLPDQQGTHHPGGFQLQPAVFGGAAQPQPAAHPDHLSSLPLFIVLALIANLSWDIRSIGWCTRASTPTATSPRRSPNPRSNPRTRS